MPLAEYPLEPAYNNEPLTRYLFLGAALMTTGILFLLCRQLPDFFVRALLWLRSRGRYRLQVVGLHHVPTDGPVILATNCEGFEDCLNVVSATDRFTRFIVVEGGENGRVGPVLDYLARRTGLVALPAGAAPEAWDKALEKGARALLVGNMVGLTAAGNEPGEADRILDRLRAEEGVTLVPVHCGDSAANDEGSLRGVRVVIGAPLKPNASLPEIQLAIRELDQIAVPAESALMH